MKIESATLSELKVLQRKNESDIISLKNDLELWFKKKGNDPQQLHSILDKSKYLKKTRMAIDSIIEESQIL